MLNCFIHVESMLRDSFHWNCNILSITIIFKPHWKLHIKENILYNIYMTWDWFLINRSFLANAVKLNIASTWNQILLFVSSPYMAGMNNEEADSFTVSIYGKAYIKYIELWYESTITFTSFG